MTVVVGAYYSRFYFEEDSYTWEKKCYVAIFADMNSGINSIAFITSEDFENQSKKNNIFKLEVSIDFQENTISHLYDLVNRKVSRVDDLYSEFLEGE